MKNLFSILILFIFSLFIPDNIYSHSGNTDANGGHYNRKTGQYHYHNSGNRSGVGSQSIGGDTSGKTSESSIGEDWYKGGTLHRANIAAWNQASYHNRLATSADWFVSISKSHNPSIYKKLDEVGGMAYLRILQSYVVPYEKCITGIALDSKLSKSDDTIAELASTCYISMHDIK